MFVDRVSHDVNELAVRQWLLRNPVWPRRTCLFGLLLFRIHNNFLLFLNMVIGVVRLVTVDFVAVDDVVHVDVRLVLNAVVLGFHSHLNHALNLRLRIAFFVADCLEIHLLLLVIVVVFKSVVFTFVMLLVLKPTSSAELIGLSGTASAVSLVLAAVRILAAPLEHDFLFDVVDVLLACSHSLDQSMVLLLGVPQFLLELVALEDKLFCLLLGFLLACLCLDTVLLVGLDALL